jgi:hypothetical protein
VILNVKTIAFVIWANAAIITHCLMGSYLIIQVLIQFKIESCLSGYINKGKCEEARISLFKGRPCMSD